MSLSICHLINRRIGPLCVKQEEHINRFNSLNKVMASMPDLYDAGKTATPEVIQSLRRDFQKSWIISSTSVSYAHDNLEAVITHYFGSTVVIPNNVKIIVPDFSNSPTLDKVLSTEEGIIYLQTLFNTIDDAETIKNVLKRLSGKSSESTILWTPNQNNRISNKDRAFGLSYYNRFGMFRVDCINTVYIGRSREVLDNPLGTNTHNASAGNRTQI